MRYLGGLVGGISSDPWIVMDYGNIDTSHDFAWYLDKNK